MPNVTHHTTGTGSRNTGRANRPLVVFDYGTVSAAIFADEAVTKDGRSFDAYHVSLRRWYRNPDGTRGYTHTLDRDDVLAGSVALLQCYQYLGSHRG